MNQVPNFGMRPDDGAAFARALRAAQRRTAVPVLFGGQVVDGVLRLSEFRGVHTNGLRGVLRAAATVHR